LPASGKSSFPVVIALHGYNSTATGFAAFHDLGAHADENGYIVVIPQGTHFVHQSESGPGRITSWNMMGDAVPDPSAGPQCLADAQRYPCPPDCGSCNRCSWASCGDDYGYFQRLLDELMDQFPIDPDRIYVLGVSNGGMMALGLGCAMSGRFAAVAPIDAQMPEGFICAPDEPLPMLHISGGKDEVVPSDGSPSADGYLYESAIETGEQWASAMVCGPNSAVWQSPEAQAIGLECRAWSGCEAPGQEVVMCLDPDESHNWPGRRPDGPWPTCVTSQQRSTMPERKICEPREGYGPHLGLDLIWSFFRRFSRRTGQGG
jgi:poly(3-hydroxybutyrate) depolymerase